MTDIQTELWPMDYGDETAEPSGNAEEGSAEFRYAADGEDSYAAAGAAKAAEAIGAAGDAEAARTAEAAGTAEPAFPLPPGIREFISSPRKPGEYAAFFRGVFKDRLKVSPDGGVWDLLAYLERETDFYTAPASTRYHGAEPCGLARHSLAVYANAIELAPVLLTGEVDKYYLTAACLFHDLCKTNMYESKLRNVKDDKTGEWKKEAFYTFRQDYISFGHGIESLLRIGKFISMPEPWKHAVRWHMGAYDMSPMDKFAMEKALAKYKEVLLLQTADLRAGMVEAI